MDLSNLKPAQGAVKKTKRIGRGQGSGRGGTATRGHKGAKSRSGYSRKLGFEGGQMPLYRRVPKYGFKNINRIEYRSINLDVIQSLITDKNIEVIDMDVLIEHGMASKNDRIKILGRGELTAKVDITAHAFSASAIKAIESKGGQATKI
ncbi:MAG: 50S ribosomal protein L15 [Lentimicrobium sp.]|jgi:large subunit ribosomal protein L15|nr:50S ribosomal protein L15 [Lentimicrobium sp.]